MVGFARFLGFGVLVFVVDHGISLVVFDFIPASSMGMRLYIFMAR